MILHGLAILLDGLARLQDGLANFQDGQISPTTAWHASGRVGLPEDGLAVPTKA